MVFDHHFSYEIEVKIREIDLTNNRVVNSVDGYKVRWENSKVETNFKENWVDLNFEIRDLVGKNILDF